jgi:hypothetical protein
MMCTSYGTPYRCQAERIRFEEYSSGSRVQLLPAVDTGRLPSSPLPSSRLTLPFDDAIVVARTGDGLNSQRQHGQNRSITARERRRRAQAPRSRSTHYSRKTLQSPNRGRVRRFDSAVHRVSSEAASVGNERVGDRRVPDVARDRASRQRIDANQALSAILFLCRDGPAR